MTLFLFSFKQCQTERLGGMGGREGAIKDAVKSSKMLRPTDNCTNLVKCSLFSVSSGRNNFFFSHRQAPHSLLSADTFM
jgi:hypothetical protein